MQIFGSDTPAAVQYLLAFIIILAVLAVFAAVLRRITEGARSRPNVPGGGSRHRQQRLGVVDAVDIDAQRQLVLLRRDNIEHLVMIGGPNDLLVESGIGRLPYRVPLNAPGGQQMHPAAPLAKTPQELEADNAVRDLFEASAGTVAAQETGRTMQEAGGPGAAKQPVLPVTPPPPLPPSPLSSPLPPVVAPAPARAAGRDETRGNDRFADRFAAPGGEDAASPQAAGLVNPGTAAAGLPPDIDASLQRPAQPRPLATPLPPRTPPSSPVSPSFPLPPAADDAGETLPQAPAAGDEPAPGLVEKAQGHISAVTRQLEEALKRPFSTGRLFGGERGGDAESASAGKPSPDIRDAQDTKTVEDAKGSQDSKGSRPAVSPAAEELPRPAPVPPHVPIFPPEPRPRTEQPPLPLPPVASMGEPFGAAGPIPVPSSRPLPQPQQRFTPPPRPSMPSPSMPSPSMPLPPQGPAAPSSDAEPQAPVPPPVFPPQRQQPAAAKQPAPAPSAPAPSAPVPSPAPAAPAPARSGASVDLSSLEDIEAEFARLLGRPSAKKED